MVGLNIESIVSFPHSKLGSEVMGAVIPVSASKSNGPQFCDATTRGTGEMLHTPNNLLPSSLCVLSS